ncbi:MAG: CHAT domain-containing protein [Cyanobacteria bacterium P01_F01_bin.150]
MTNLKLNDSLNQSAFNTRIWSIGSLSLLGLTGLWLIGTPPSHGQSITPANDGTGTIVNQDGQHIQINGGSLSADGYNLFHSFDDFGLDRQSVAEFLSQPETQNILGRIVGGNTSVIDGLIQVSGSDANLFLMNPAGMIFGANAQLDVPSSFTATTATGIGFGDQWFHAIGDNDYHTLLNDPHQFAFHTIQPGSLLNEGNLHVSSGHSLMLLGGTVVNTGHLTAPSGLITLVSVPGEHIVRMSHDDMVLSLEFEILASAQTDLSPLPFTPLSLLDLLVGGSIPDHANSLTIKDDGAIHLTSADTTIDASFATAQPGTLITSGSLSTSSAPPASPAPPATPPLNSITLVGDRVATLNATLSADGTQGGGSIRIGGNPKGADGLPTSTQTVVDATTTLSANAIDNGDGGNITIWADQTTTMLGQLSATGGQLGGNGGFVEVSADHVNLDTNNDNIDLTALHGEVGTLLIDPIDIRIVDGTGANDGELVPDGQIFAADGTGEFTLSASQLEKLAGDADVILEAKRHITIDNLASDELTFQSGPGSITFTADADLDNIGDFTMDPSDSLVTNGRDITITGVNLSLGAINATGLGDRGGNIQLNSQDTVTVAQNLESLSFADKGGTINVIAGGDITLGENSLDESILVLGQTTSGNIQLTSQTGSIQADGEISSASFVGKAGNVNISAYADVNLGNGSDQAVIDAFGISGGGDITITTTVGNIDVSQGSLNSVSADGPAGRVSLDAGGNIAVGTDALGDGIYSGGANQQGGNISLISRNGTITVEGELDSESDVGNAGSIFVQAAGDVILGSDTAASNATGSAISSIGGQTSGSITILSENGAIDTSLGSLSSSSEQGVAGSITLSATKDIIVGEDVNGVAIASVGTNRGGEINLTSQAGNIDASQGMLASSSTDGTAGHVTLTAQQNIAVADIVSAGDVAGGAVQITSQQGAIDGSSGAISSIAESGQAGSVNIQAQGNVTIGNRNPIETLNQLDLLPLDLEDDGASSIRSQGLGRGGQVTVTSQQGAIAIGGIIDSISDQGTAGDVRLDAYGEITLGDRITSAGRTRGGSISLSSETTGLDTRSIALESFSEDGSAGNITLTAQEQLQVGPVNSSGLQQGGTIKLSSNTNAVTATDTLNSASDQGQAGSILIQANTTIDTADIESAGRVQGGNIDIVSTDSDITIAGNINSFSEQGTAGSVTLRTNGNLTARQILSEGGQQGGGVHLHGNTVDLSQGFIGSFSETGTAGSVEITATNDIVLGTATDGTSVSSDGSTRGGAVTLTSDQGNIDVWGNILSLSANGVAGNVTVSAQDQVSLGGDINSESRQRGGDIVISTQTQGLDTRSIALRSESAEGTAGDITLSARETILTGEVDSEGKEHGGNIAITSDRAITATAQLNSLSDAGTAGDVTLTAQADIEVTNIYSTGTQRGGSVDLTSQAGNIRVTETLESRSLAGDAGRVTLNAAGAITSGDIVSDGQQKGGHVSLTSGDRLTVSTINSFSEQGTAGNVTLTAEQAVKVGQTDDQTQNQAQDFTDPTTSESPSSSIRSEGQAQGGSITITSAANITVTGTIDSFSTDGFAGDLAIQSQGQIQVGDDIRTEGAQRGGDITIQAQTGGLELGAIALESRSSQGRAGDVLLASPGTITTGTIDSEGQQRGGNITITSETGAIATTDRLTSLSDQGKAGSVTLTAQDDITVAGIFSQGQRRGGDISVTSETGGISADVSLASFSEEGRAGTVELSASENVMLTGSDRAIQSRGGQRGGDITVTSENGSIRSDGRLVTQSPNGTAGDVTLRANQVINLQDGEEKSKSIRSRGLTQGGDITLISENGRVQTDGSLISISDEGVAGSVTVQAANNIRIDGQLSSALDSEWSVRTLGYDEGGDITLISQLGQVRLNGQLITFSPEGIAGDVTIISYGNITLPPLNQSQAIRSQGRDRGGNVRLISNTRQLKLAGNLDSFSEDGIGGAVELLADGSITVGHLRTFGNEQSGDVTITSTTGGIATGDISTTAPNGISGNVTLSAQMDISTGDVSSTGLESGDINLSSVEGEILTGTVTSTTGTVEVGDEASGDSEGIVGGAPKAVVSDTKEAIAEIEEQREQEYSTYFGRDLTVEAMTPEAIQDILANVKQETGNESAIVYVSAPRIPPDSVFTNNFTDDNAIDASNNNRKQVAWKQDESDIIGLFENPLEILVFTLDGQPTRITVPEVSRDQLFQTIAQFRNQLVLSERRGTHQYIPVAQQLYQWLIAPLEAELGPEAVDTLLFSMDSGLRGLPIAALHDGEQFMIEKYSVGMVPSVGLMDTQYRAIDNAEVLAMGADTFTDQTPLPAVPVEVETITQLQGGTVFLNEDFTQENLTRHQAENPHRIIHLATHAAFNPGTADNSYIQLWGHERLNLNEVQNLGWHSPSVDLLVLSACQTAVGNADAEMGFAGLAVASGVRSALASLWTISDEGTLALMTEFYDQLDNSMIKSEALRQSQLAMLNGTIQIDGGELRRGEARDVIDLPKGVGGQGDRDLSHPYYWSGFTMIGSPW